MKNNYHSNGKLLLTAEYLVLDGAKALAVPTNFGQSMAISEGKKGYISWKSINERNEVWLEEAFCIGHNGDIQAVGEMDISIRLEKILTEANRMKPGFFSEKSGFDITTNLEFPQNWGLGSSSTLIHNLAEWMGIDAYDLLQKTFGGSGYDIACAKNNAPISFQLKAGNRKVLQENFEPPFQNQLFFVHLNEKQNSRDAISHYKNQPKEQLSNAVERISQITDEMISCQAVTDFEKLIEEHEQILSSLLQIPPVKKRLFSDYPNAIKSLGAWGGDFVLAVGGEKEKKYFREKGFSTILDYSEMVL